MFWYVLISGSKQRNQCVYVPRLLFEQCCVFFLSEQTIDVNYCLFAI